MRCDALEVFYSSAHFNFNGDDLRLTLSFLRDILPREGLSRLRRVEFTMNTAQCICWTSSSTEFKYKNSLQAIVALLAEHANLPHLSITVNMRQCLRSIFGNCVVFKPDEIISADTFRFVYRFYIAVATAMCLLRGLGGVNLELYAFEQLRPWLEREVLGYDKERTFQSLQDKRHEEALWERPQQFQTVPPYHDNDQRLQGSNYQPDT